jgi:hypothetical protein
MWEKLVFKSEYFNVSATQTLIDPADAMPKPDRQATSTETKTNLVFTRDLVRML